MSEKCEVRKTLEDWWNIGFDGFFDKSMRTPETINAVSVGATATEFSALVNGWLTAGEYSDEPTTDQRSE